MVYTKGHNKTSVESLDIFLAYQEVLILESHLKIWVLFDTQCQNKTLSHNENH